MTAVLVARLAAPVLVEEASDGGARDGAEAEMAESGQDGAVETDYGRRLY